MGWGARGRVLAVMVVAVLALAVGETLLSKGMKQIAGPGREAGGIGPALRCGWLWAGAGLLLVHLVLYMVVLGEADLSFALPLTAASYPLTAWLSQAFLHERIGPMRWAGTAIITLGVVIVGAFESPAK